MGQRSTIDLERLVAEHRWLLWAWFGVGVVRAALGASSGSSDLLSSLPDAPNSPTGPTTATGGLGAAASPPSNGPRDGGPEPDAPSPAGGEGDAGGEGNAGGEGEGSEGNGSEGNGSEDGDWDDFWDDFYGMDVDVNDQVARNMVETGVWTALQGIVMPPVVGEGAALVEGGPTVKETLENVDAHNQRNEDALNRDWSGTSHLTNGDD